MSFKNDLRQIGYAIQSIPYIIGDILLYSGPTQYAANARLEIFKNDNGVMMNTAHIYDSTVLDVDYGQLRKNTGSNEEYATESKRMTEKLVELLPYMKSVLGVNISLDSEDNAMARKLIEAAPDNLRSLQINTPSSNTTVAHIFNSLDLTGKELRYVEVNLDATVYPRQYDDDRLDAVDYKGPAILISQPIASQPA